MIKRIIGGISVCILTIGLAMQASASCWCGCDHWSPRDYYPKVTALHSINNRIDGCFYKPKLSETMDLMHYVIDNGGFASVYTESFDRDNEDEYKPHGTQTRALEILGYDFLLSNEYYDFYEGYSCDLALELDYKTAIMDIYKALGKEEYEVQVFYSPDPSITMENSPVVKDIPSYVTGLDTSKGRTDIFISRTKPKLYLEKAEKDLKSCTPSNYYSPITCGDFIVLLQEMMHLYGEPVLSEQETNELLQVYGHKIPLGVRSTYKDALIYLYARGVLNEQLDMSAIITVEQACDILMRVKDKDSRTNYKEIKLTKSIENSLIEKGYFPATMNVHIGDDALEYDTYNDYSTAYKYDYLVSVPSEYEFRTSNGLKISRPYIPETTSYASPPLDGSEFLGIQDGMYHFRVPISYSSGRDEIIINTSSPSDSPKCWILPPGGGIYTFSRDNGGEIMFSRENFDDNSYPGLATKERRSEGTPMMHKLLRAFTTTAFAAESQGVGNQNGVTSYLAIKGNIVHTNLNSGTEVTYNDLPSDAKKQFAAHFKSALEDKVDGTKWMNDLTYVHVLNSSLGEALAELPHAGEGAVVTETIANLTGDILIDYDLLYAEDLVIREEAPMPEDGVLRIQTKRGDIVLNNNTHEIRVGTVVYRVPADHELWYIASEGGRPKLSVDFRVIYGWASDKLKAIYTKSANSDLQALSINPPDSSYFAGHPISSRAVTSGKQNRGTGILNTVKVIDNCVILSSEYDKASWVVYLANDRETGAQHDYLINYYPKVLADRAGIDDESDDVTDAIGYCYKPDDAVVTIRKLNREHIITPGRLSYIEGIGYVYNLPGKFDYEKYLKGSCALPLVAAYSGTNNCIFDMNTNLYEAVNYTAGVILSGYNLRDNTCTFYSAKNDTKTTIELDNIKRGIALAPVGVHTFYGDKPQVASISSLKTYDSVYYYLGSETAQPMGYSSVLLSDNIVLDIGSKAKAVRVSSDNQGGEYFSIIVSDVTVSANQEVANKFETVNLSIEEDLPDVFEDSVSYKLRALLNSIDNGVSILNTIIYYIVPLVGIVVLTILLGLAVIGDSSMARYIVAHTIDPVYLLTFGKRRFDEFDITNAAVSYILAYLAFALLADGNFLKLTIWLIEQYDSIMKLIR